MVARVIWTRSAQADRRSILAYWRTRNGNSNYSLKLHARLRSAVNDLRRSPYLGRPSELEGIRQVVVGNYIVFYEAMPGFIIVHHIWDGRRDLPSLKF